MQVVRLTDREKIEALAEAEGFEYTDELRLQSRLLRPFVRHSVNDHMAENPGTVSILRESVLRPQVRLALGNIGGQLGWGCFVLDDLPAGTLLGHYAGVLMGKGFFRWVYDYGMSYCGHFLVDAVDAGNFARFINHSVRENVGFALEHCEEDGLLYRVARLTRDVRRGEQLAYNYGPGYWKGQRNPVEVRLCLNDQLTEVVLFEDNFDEEPVRSPAA
jgi:hypothetical protein